MPNASKLSVLALLFALGALAAWTLGASGRNAETTTVVTATAAEATTPVVDTTTESTLTTDATATTTESVTEPATDTTAAATTTVQVTTTRIVTLPTLTDTTSSSSDDGTDDWVWVLLAILAVGLVALIVLLARRGRGSPAVSMGERRGRLDAAVASWTAQGWVIENDTADSVQLRRGAEAMLLTVDPAGHVSTHPLQSG